ncbi:TauD/TfdA family dioxygenase [Micromonospora sp. KLBMP9576]|uniref:TauD/TfdA family dioxygenase n=1 Tax=Micromonospora sp. KLBMP9576 TaxID=3424769 RepID=UPI003D930066
MSIDTRTTSTESALTVVRLDEQERQDVRALATDLAGQGAALIDDAEWLRVALLMSNRLPLAVRDALRLFRRDPGRSGVLLVRNLPDFGDLLPPTPAVMDSVQRSPSGPAGVLAMVMLQIGELIAYRAEKFGALVQDVVPVPGQERFQGNAGSAALRMHVENAFHEHRPHYVSLLGLRPDHDHEAGLLIASVREAAELLPEDTRAVLAERRFVTTAPASFGASGTPTPHAVLEGDGEDPDVRVDFTSTSALDPRAAAAIDEFGQAVRSVCRTVELLPGDLVVVDNRITLHGRTSFRPRYDGRDRWLQRAFAYLDGRRSRPARIGGGNVLT